MVLGLAGVGNGTLITGRKVIHDDVPIVRLFMAHTVHQKGIGNFSEAYFGFGWLLAHVHIFILGWHASMIPHIPPVYCTGVLHNYQ